jgi:FMN phosphatase YigB (HAD superfamily)
MAKNGKTLGGVLFDLGGVLVDDSREVVFAHISKVLGVPVPKLAATMYRNTPDLQRGLETTLQFWYRMCDKLCVSRPADNILLELLTKPYTKENVRAKHDTLAIVRRIAQKYPVGVVSNTIPEHIRVHRDDGVFDDFSAVILSYEVALRKPQKEIFELASSRLKVPLEKLIFVDNEMRWVKAARKAGMKATLFTSADKLEASLRRSGLL